MPPEPPACEWPCGCDGDGRATSRVWYAGCAAGCPGHLMCRRHTKGNAFGIVRWDYLT
jgi:hypothetical protein